MTPTPRAAGRSLRSTHSTHSTQSIRSIVALALAVVLLVGLAPSSAQASPETLRRAVGNLVQAPIDAVLSPVVAGRTLYRNLHDIEDTPAVRVFYAAPGYLWLTGVQFGSAILRGVAGGLELIPGIFLIPFKTDIAPLYDPAERGAAMIEYENPLAENSVMKWIPIVTWNVRFGVTYTSAEQ